MADPVNQKGFTKPPILEECNKIYAERRARRQHIRGRKDYSEGPGEVAYDESEYQNIPEGGFLPRGYNNERS